MGERESRVRKWDEGWRRRERGWEEEVKDGRIGIERRNEGGKNERRD